MKKKQYFLGFLILFTGLFFTAFVTKKPKILIIGDSISIGYTPFVKSFFTDKVLVLHNHGNAQHTGTGLSKIKKWPGNEDWDIIQFNLDIWDLCFRHPDSKEYGNRDKINGKPEFIFDQYASNLDSLVTIIKNSTNAKLIMEKHSVMINNIYEQSISIHNEFGIGSNEVHYKKEGYEKLGEIIANFLETQMQ